MKIFQKSEFHCIARAVFLALECSLSFVLCSKDDSRADVKKPLEPVEEYLEDGTFLFRLYSPEISRIVIQPADNRYKHVPSIAYCGDKDLLGGFLVNNESGEESKMGQTAVIIRSSDGGFSWSEPVPELNLAEYSESPLTPVQDGRIQGEIHLNCFDGEEYACLSHRGGKTGENPLFISKRRDGGKWKTSRVVFTSKNQPYLSSTVNGTKAPAGTKNTYNIAGEEYDVIFFKPVGDDDGKILIPAVFMTKYGGRHRAGVFLIHGQRFSLMGLVPDNSDIEVWEPTLWKDSKGIYHMQCRNNKGIGGDTYDNHVLASSGNLTDWTEWEYLCEHIHVNRNMRYRMSDNLWLGVGSVHKNLRHGLSLWLSPDGKNWNHGICIGNENLKTDWTQYNDICTDGHNAYVLYSESIEKDLYSGVNSIGFASFRLPDSNSLAVMGSSKSYYETNGAISRPLTEGNNLILPPGCSGTVSVPTDIFELTVKVKMTETPQEGKPYTLMAIGDTRNGFWAVECRNTSGKYQIVLNNKVIEELSDPTDFTEFAVFIDCDKEVLKIGKEEFMFKSFPRVYLGNYYSSLPTPAGDLIYDVSGFSLKTFKRKYSTVP